MDDKTVPLPPNFAEGAASLPPPVLPDLRPAIERELIEWDWRMQDGILTAREPRTWAQAIELVLAARRPVDPESAAAAVPLDDLLDQWEQLRQRAQTSPNPSETTRVRNGSSLWQRVHWLRREIVLRQSAGRHRAAGVCEAGAIVFQPPVDAVLRHVCATGWRHSSCSRHPGRSMRTRQLTNLPAGSYQHPEVSWDGRRILFAYCEVPTVPPDRRRIRNGSTTSISVGGRHGTPATDQRPVR